MIKAIVFDLDGVLVDTDKLHLNALNAALEAAGEEPMSWNEHLEIYKGRPTAVKLEMMAARRGLSRTKFDAVAAVKRERTAEMIARFVGVDAEKVEMMRLLRRDGYALAVASNAITASVELMLTHAGLLGDLEFYLGNEAVANNKPAPDIYLEAFRLLGASAREVVIVEDSDIGKAAARASGGVVCEVRDASDVNYYRVKNVVRGAEMPQVVIPAAGQGKRFFEVGYQHPKPLIDVLGRPMLAHVLDDFSPIKAKTVVLMQERHIERYCAHETLNYCQPGITVVGVDGLTEGAACTLLLSEPYLDPNAELLMANSDQKVDASIEAFLFDMRAQNADGGIMTFRDNHPKWSFARTDESGRVVEVAEKNPISDQATVGIYYWRRAGDFFRYVRQMMAKNIRVNGEFYTCPVFNELIGDGGDVRVWEIQRSQMHGLGTPEDLAEYLAPACPTA